MPIIQRHNCTESITLREFADVAKQTDVSTAEGLLSLGETFTKLGNNREFLSNFFAQFIKNQALNDPLATLLSQSVVLLRTSEFYLRANFWLPKEGISNGEAVLFAYDQPHDHNFDLLSLAYCGDGYISHGYTYDYDSTVGYVGERVALQPLGPHKHECGDVLMYECNKDIHIQKPPADPSITLNVIPLANQNGLRDQYFFDIDHVDSTFGILRRHAPNIQERRRFLFDIAKYVANDEITGLFADFARKHECKRTRYEALRALKTCNAAVHDELVHALRDDSAPIVKHYVASVLSA